MMAVRLEGCSNPSDFRGRSEGTPGPSFPAIVESPRQLEGEGEDLQLAGRLVPQKRSFRQVARHGAGWLCFSLMDSAGNLVFLLNELVRHNEASRLAIACTRFPLPECMSFCL